ncbi:MAG: monofunctional biosynthetic peptidoglycan transglycosylase [Candidatus Eisenbacteria bacterium]|nr:monofunctional biosynthetic peptidoglycan transglycosylase [Candidatus Eisenbacteria bacterium]
MKRALLGLVLLAAAALAASAMVAALRARTVDVASLATRVPRRTALMRQREAGAAAAGRGYRVRQAWVPYDRIAPLLRRAVLVAEDDAFYRHGGLDWNELRAAARRDLEERRVVRGGSTITQQLAKNLFLGDRRTLMRKLEEAFLALRMERALPKRRIFELYLNLIEWGDGVFGAEAAARHWFGVPASELTPRQAVLLAAVIINPRRYSPLQPSRRIERRARLIASRLRRRGALSAAEYLEATGAAPRPDTTAAAPGSPVTPATPPADLFAAPAETTRGGPGSPGPR